MKVALLLTIDTDVFRDGASAEVARVLREFASNITARGITRMHDHKSINANGHSTAVLRVATGDADK